MHERIAINSQCFGVPTWDELANYCRDLHVRRLSYGGILSGKDPTPLRDLLAAGGHKLQSIVHPFFYGRHLVPDKDVWAEEQAKLNGAIDTAASLGARVIYMSTGGIGPWTWEEAAEIFCSAIAPCVAHAKTAGVAITIENTLSLYANVHIAHSLRDTVALAEMADIGVTIDTFGCWTESGLRETIRRAAPRLGLIQVADYVLGDKSVPARAVPGDGAIPLKRMFDWILSAGYGGAFEIEMLGPRIDKEGYAAATRRAADNVGQMLHSLGA